MTRRYFYYMNIVRVDERELNVTTITLNASSIHTEDIKKGGLQNKVPAFSLFFSFTLFFRYISNLLGRTMLLCLV